MQTVTRTRTTPGRVGSLRSARKALWCAIHAARGVLSEAQEPQAQEPQLVLDACKTLCACIREYLALVRAIENYEDKT